VFELPIFADVPEVRCWAKGHAAGTVSQCVKGLAKPTGGTRSRFLAARLTRTPPRTLVRQRTDTVFVRMLP
jgi:hypothetical protein